MKARPFGGTGLRFSEMALGTATFVGRWRRGTDTDDSAAISNAHAEAGANFIDTPDI